MNTRVHIADPVNPERLFLHVLGILEADPAFTPAWECPSENGWPAPEPGPLSLGKATYKHVRKGDVRYLNHSTGEPILEDDNEYRTTLGQGLACIWEVTYAADGPLVWPDDEWRDEGEPEPDPASFPMHLVSANFDTAYGYRDASGAGCADLHAFLLREIGAFISDARWAWMHEEKGSWHGPGEIHLRGNPDLSVLNAVVRRRQVEGLER